MAIAISRSSDAPMGELNTTPLIDVMLVLLVMIIITIPVATHSLPVDLPSSEGTVDLNPVQNKIVVTQDGAILWNGEGVTRNQLAIILNRVAAMKPEPTTLFEPDGNAAYQRTAEVLQTVRQTRITKFAFVGNERYRGFDAD